MKTQLEEFCKSIETFVTRLQLNKTFYFDESNNIRKGIIGEKKDNNPDLENMCFVLGGIAIDKPLDFGNLLTFIGAKQVPLDAKFKFFSYKKTKFEDIIEQPRIRKLFDYLKENKIIIHFDVLHYMYFALTDILDSFIEEKDISQHIILSSYKIFQNDMAEVLFKNYDRLHKILVEYEFPNISKAKANQFIKDIVELYCDNLRYFNMANKDNFTKELLRQIIKSKTNKKNLIFLEGNISFEISSSVFQNYICRMLEFKDKKIFDTESVIIRELTNMDSQYETKLNVNFENSTDVREIQISDTVCGFVSRLYNFLCRNDEEKIKNFIDSLSKESESYKTLKVFFELIDISDAVSAILIKQTLPLFLIKRLSLLCNLLNSK